MTNNTFNIQRNAERGNILFLILIAAALFAALSYVIVNATRSGGGDAEREKARLAASDVMNQVTAIRTAVGRLLINGCGAEQLSFENINDTVHVNPNAPANGRCDIFGTSGGGVPARTADPNWATDEKYYFAGSSAISDVGTTCTDTDCADLTMNLTGVSQTLCLQLNAANGIRLPLSQLPSDTQAICPFEGTFDCNGNGVAEVVFTDPKLLGRNSYCYNDTVKGLTFTHVILER